MDFSINVHITDPYASPNEVAHEYKFSLTEKISEDYDAVILAVAHKEYRTYDAAYFKSITTTDPILIDIKSFYNFDDKDLTYWKL